MTINRDDFNRDEVRRELRESRRQHDELMPTFRSMLARVFDRGRPEDKAALLGVDLPGGPTRRALIGGGATLAGVALLTACTDAPKKEQLAQTGTVPDAKAPATLSPQKAAELAAKTDLTLLRTAQSVEALAIVAYGFALSSGKLTTATVTDAAKLFQSQHTDHEGAITSQIKTMGGQPYDNPDAGPPPSGVDAKQWTQVNPTLWKQVMEPVLGNADSLDQTKILKLALALENVAAETYTKAGGILSSPALRSFIMSIGGIEARHCAVINGVLTPDDPRQQAPFAFEKVTDAVPPDAYVGSGDTSNVKIATTTTTARSTTTKKSTGSTGAGGSAGSTKAGGGSTTVKS